MLAPVMVTYGYCTACMKAKRHMFMYRSSSANAPGNAACRILAGMMAVFFGCATISQFDQYAYTQVTSVKVDAMNIMDSATGDYLLHKAEVMKVMTAIDKLYEYEKHRPKNIITEKMWNEIRDSSGHLFGGYVKRWAQEGKLDRTFIQEAKAIVGQSFDQIAQLESRKLKPTQVPNQP